MSNEHKLKSAEEWRRNVPRTWLKGEYVVSETHLVEFINQIQQNAIREGVMRAIKVVQKRADDYDSEHGWTDMETGTREYPNNGDDYMLELTEIQEAILAAANKLEGGE